MTTEPRTIDPVTGFPPRCVRGPETVAADTIQDAIQTLDADALATYQNGLDLLNAIWQRLQEQPTLTELRQLRAFYLARLRTLERQDAAVVDQAVLAPPPSPAPPAHDSATEVPRCISDPSP